MWVQQSSVFVFADRINNHAFLVSFGRSFCVLSVGVWLWATELIISSRERRVSFPAFCIHIIPLTSFYYLLASVCVWVYCKYSILIVFYKPLGHTFFAILKSCRSVCNSGMPPEQSQAGQSQECFGRFKFLHAMSTKNWALTVDILRDCWILPLVGSPLLQHTVLKETQ